MLSIYDGYCQVILLLNQHGERAKLNRRAIASANMIMRMFLYGIEEMHLRLSKTMRGSTISIGGEEKKMKITLTMQNARLNHQDLVYTLQATQDATKWNKCLSPPISLLCFMRPYSMKKLEMS